MKTKHLYKMKGIGGTNVNHVEGWFDTNKEYKSEQHKNCIVLHINEGLNVMFGMKLSNMLGDHRGGGYVAH